MTPVPAWRRRKFVGTLPLTAGQRRGLADAARDVFAVASARGKHMQVDYTGPGTGTKYVAVEQEAENDNGGHDGYLDRGPGAFVSGLEVGEPIFVVRARDALALGFLTQYAAQAQYGELFDQPRSEQLASDIQRFVKWRRSNADRVRDPD